MNGVLRAEAAIERIGIRKHLRIQKMVKTQRDLDRRIRHGVIFLY